MRGSSQWERGGEERSGDRKGGKLRIDKQPERCHVRLGGRRVVNVRTKLGPNRFQGILVHKSVRNSGS